jgi:hypothetical protein
MIAIPPAILARPPPQIQPESSERAGADAKAAAEVDDRQDLGERLRNSPRVEVIGGWRPG